MNSTSVTVNMLMGVLPLATTSGSGCGKVSVSRIIMAVRSACIEIIHQRLVFTTSTMGLQMPLRNQGK